jgi:TonB family protein
MNRLEKKCLIASASTHLFLLLLLILGSAFFVAEPKPSNLPRIKVYSPKMIDALLAGGGGNPKLPPSDAQEKGQTLAQPPAPAPSKPPTPKPPTPTPPSKPIEPVVKRAEPAKPTKPAPAKPRETVKENPKPSLDLKPVPRETPTPPLDLKPVVRDNAERERVAKEERAREQAAANRRLANQLAKAAESLKSGFAAGVAVEAYGPGGEAYANYAAWVKEVYDNAWNVTDDLTDESSVTRVTVTIASTGEVLSARILKPSGNPDLDKSVQRTLNAVRFIRPFPEGAKDKQRTFTINFNLKSKRGLG